MFGSRSFLLFLLAWLLFTPTQTLTAAKLYDGILSPTDFGANGNDNKDDTEAFQKCIDAAKKRNASKIVVTPGRYIIGKAITIENVSNLIIEGSGAILEKPSSNGSNILYGHYNKQITIRDLIFEGNRTSDFKEEWPHKMNACAIIGRSSGIRFENCVVKDFHYGICLGTSTENGYDVWVENCQFENNNSDIDLYGKPSLHISGNVSHNCTGHSIQIEPPYKREAGIFDYRDQPKIDALSIGNIISENVIVGCKGVGIIIFGGCENVTACNNQIINYGTAGIMTHTGSRNITIRGNIISNSQFTKTNDRPWKDQGAGIILSRVDNAIVEGNIISHPNTGIYLSGTHGAILSNNKISDAKDAGVCLYDATSSLLTGNHIQNYNLNMAWWGNSGIVVYNSRGVNIASSMISDENSNGYAIFTSNSNNIEVKDVIGIGYSKSLTYPSNLYKE